MRIYKYTGLLVALTFFALTACSTRPDGPSDLPGRTEIEGEVIRGCEGLIGTYETAGPRPLEAAPPGEPFSAWLLAFTTDGRVLWKYTPEVYSGAYTCRGNVITATFAEGPRTAFEGVFDPQNEQITIEDILYNKVTEE